MTRVQFKHHHHHPD
ncbi:TPA: his operon leader peptide [Salmonella enterica subsp. indica]|uniref:his operon leader peptide n=3 Tax=Salmonella enterica TaxID=28901 RepID=A0A5Y2QQC8_SALER|nr:MULTISPECIES: his operon leader peptide [Enterobacteriaceae]ECF4924629.1 his operon leader peptide [Salmonella enterica subsp. arizonae]ECX5665668.1 his operon leader peptide [Salmonella enterica subsp. enterica serovar Newport]EEM2500844.1 his operon leader peptide [Salmonella enterica subsp. indica serovar 45:a:e,n,x]EFW1363653.1 his operon leader peptide [Shigella sonnei]EHM3443742.1 his operon leader peptide [Salmonella enterica subsp. enterica]HAE8194990.1 his operon leader peptide [S